MYLDTGTGYEMFEMLSMMQKAIRRGDYEYAGFAAEQLRKKFRNAMWNRLLVISAEDCFGIITKEIIQLRKLDGENSCSDEYVSDAVALLCRALKSRDACYFACNFVLASRNPRQLNPSAKDVERFNAVQRQGSKVGQNYDRFGFEQLTLFNSTGKETKDLQGNIKNKESIIGAGLAMAINHKDMDMIGHYISQMRSYKRNLLWSYIEEIAKDVNGYELQKEIEALKKADDYVNAKKSNKDEIFISKAIILLCYASEENGGSLLSSEIVDFTRYIDWEKHKVKSISSCQLLNGCIPEWVYDCHTYKGKRKGKTLWNMIITEQAALYPLKKGYFDEASWLYTCEQNYRNGVMNDKQMQPAREYAKTHEANPVKFIPYE